MAVVAIAALTSLARLSSPWVVGRTTPPAPSRAAILDGVSLATSGCLELAQSSDGCRISDVGLALRAPVAHASAWLDGRPLLVSYRAASPGRPLDRWTFRQPGVHLEAHGGLRSMTPLPYAGTDVKLRIVFADGARRTVSFDVASYLCRACNAR
jgi:hypothetical protein